MSKETISKEASALSSRGASKGGLARAQALDSETRRAIATEAAAARWGAVQIADSTGEIIIGQMQLSCAVLEDQTRVLSQSTVLQALGRNPEKSRRTRGASSLRAPFLLANNLQPFITDELRDMEEPIPYRVKGESARAWGYRAEMLPLVCEVYLEARREGALAPSQRATAAAAEILQSGLARVGIIALVDEATGYQEKRSRDELRLILERYVQSQFRPWVKMFPDEFFEQVYRLHGWDYTSNKTARPGYVGKLINRYVYDQLPEGVTQELQRINPKNNRGHRSRRHHQHLTADTGNVHLDRQISTVITLMRISDSKPEFDDLFDRAFAPQLRLPLVIETKADG